MAPFSFVQFFREQWTALPTLRSVSEATSKTYMVTGSNVGLGFEACVHLARMGPMQLVATCRDRTKCTTAREAILERVANDTGDVHTDVAMWPLDLTSFDSVRAFADRFATEGNGSLDVLINNAGVFCTEYAQTSDGWELTLQVNYLSTALLSILLLPHLVNASTAHPQFAARLVVVSSVAHYLAGPSLKHAETWTHVLDTINSRKFCAGSERYKVSKLLGVLFVRELAARLPDPNPVVACTVNPGYCDSGLFRAMENTWYIAWALPLLRRLFFVRSTEQGSKTLVHAAVAGDAHAMHGRYLSSCQVAEESDFVFTPKGKAFAAKLWDETIAVLSRIDQRVPEIVEKYLRMDV